MGYSTEKNETSEILVFLLRLFALEFEIQVEPKFGKRAEC